MTPTRPEPPPEPCALVLMGGGARTAYQVGVLQALAGLLASRRGAGAAFPFRILVGTSAGALNAACLAGFANQGLQAFTLLARFWQTVRSEDVYQLDLPRWARASRFMAALSLSGQARGRSAMLDTMPLVDTLHRVVSLNGIETALHSGVLDALAVTASSYTSGVHWTFCHTARDAQAKPWQRPGRRAEFQPVTIEHLMASSAIPLLFPATALWVDGRREYFGDGTMRQTSPLSPAIHLGARRVLVVGVGQPQRSGLGQDAATDLALHEPTFGSIAGHAMASVFHDTLQADVALAQRVTQALRALPPDAAAHFPYRPVEVLALQPSASLDALALAHAAELPAATRHALDALGGLRGGGAALASYLLFEPGFVQALMALGAQDALARQDELLAFLAPG